MTTNVAMGVNAEMVNVGFKRVMYRSYLDTVNGETRDESVIPGDESVDELLR